MLAYFISCDARPLVDHVEVWYELIPDDRWNHHSPRLSDWWGLGVLDDSRIASCLLRRMISITFSLSSLQVAGCLIRLLKRINLGCFDLFGPSVQFICNL